MNDQLRLDARKIQTWIQENADVLSEDIPVELCPSHEDGGETCWGQDGHVWKKGHFMNFMILTICHPRAEDVFT